MKPIVNLLVFLSLLYVASAGITQEQLKGTAATIRKICQPKTKVSDDVVDKIREREFPADKAGKCFIQCVLENMSMMRKNKINYESAMKQFDLLLPDDMKDDYKNALTRCKDVANGEKNPCEAALKIVTCFSTDNPKFTFV